MNIRPLKSGPLASVAGGNFCNYTIYHALYEYNCEFERENNDRMF